MENELLKTHIESILPLVFNEEADSLIVNIYSKLSGIPSFLNIQVELEYDFLIVLQSNNNKLLETKIKKLSILLSKQINQKVETESVFLFWFEGLQIDFQNEKKLEQTQEYEPIIIDKLKTETRLPNWLDKYIFENLLAYYEPDFVKFDYNLEHTNKELLVYLGTYFPRSFAEAFCIYEDLFSNFIINNEIKNKNALNILDIGCGTGGNLLGLLTAINKHYPTIQTINVWAVDGNLQALKILENIIIRFNLNFSNKINFTLINETFKEVNEISAALDSINCTSFDLIMTFKTIVEIVSKGIGLNNNAYYQWFEVVSDLLNANGLALIADVTTKTDHSDYMPLLLNEQARIFVNNHPSFKILSPLSCNCYSNICSNRCFYQHEFFVSHRQKNKDASRIAYKIIGRSTFVEKITKDKKKGKFVINWKQYNKDSTNVGICINSIGGDTCIDAYKIS